MRVPVARASLALWPIQRGRFGSSKRTRQKLWGTGSLSNEGSQVDSEVSGICFLLTEDVAGEKT